MNECIRSTRRPLRATAALPLLALISGCSLPAPAPFPTPSASHHTTAGVSKTAPAREPRMFTARVMLHGSPLELHLAAPDQTQSQATPSTDPGTLVLYASGDGGWFGAAVDMFKQIARAGYPVVGFSSKAFLKIQRPHGKLVNAAQLAADYESIVTQARAALHQSESSRVIFTGWSRGAAFSVLAGSEPATRDHLAGVIAIGLGPGEDLAVADEADDEGSDDGSASETGRRWQFDTYATIARLDPVACAVIQASRDNYFPAAEARRLFGPDTERRRFYAIDARNHRFTGGKAAFDAALVDALHWIVSHPVQAVPPVTAKVSS
jgi:dienelactone hydrolase